MLAEYARERRLFVPIEAIPEKVIQGFLAAEDKNYYSHPGVDAFSLARAVIINAKNKFAGTNRRAQGASTITQQVAKNFLLSSDRTLERKVKEAILSMRMESVYSKDKILELYLNEIYMGMGAYGVVAAAQEYFDKPLETLTVAEIAYLAALPKGPNNYNPVRHYAAAMERRNWVLSQMQDAGFIDRKKMKLAQAEPIETRQRQAAESVNAPYFSEEVRRRLVEKYGFDDVYEKGMTVFTSIEPELQEIAERSLWNGVRNYDRKYGWRGAITTLKDTNDYSVPKELDNQFVSHQWRLAVVKDSDAQKADIILKTGEKGEIPWDELRWARKQQGKYLGPVVQKASDVLNAGDVIYVSHLQKDSYTLEQPPAVNGALVAMDVHTGRVRAMVGGFSYEQSEFNRATQAKRQPGSTFKPFVYLAALEKDYKPTTRILDAPITISQGPGLPAWKPENYSNEFYGPTTLRQGLEKSRNVMTVRIARSIGIKSIQDVAKRFNIDPNMRSFYSAVLGANETTVLQLTTAYAMLANGGKQIEPTLIDRVQNYEGKTIFNSDDRACLRCSDHWKRQAPPSLRSKKRNVTDPGSAYQVVSMLEGVIQRGTGRSISLKIQHPLAGKTGTTNEGRDAWFVGFSPDLAVGIYIGFDQPKSLGNRETGGSVAAPVFRDFMAAALENVSPKPFPVPPEIKLVSVALSSGRKATGPGTIMEAFKQEQFPEEQFFYEEESGFASNYGPYTLPPAASENPPAVQEGSTEQGNVEVLETVPTFTFEGVGGVY